MHKIVITGGCGFIGSHLCEYIFKIFKKSQIVIIDKITYAASKKNISKNPYELSENKLCSWTEVECLGACVNAPIMQINQDYFEDLDEDKTNEIIKKLLKDEFPQPGSAKNRKNNAPENGKTTLLEITNA